MLLDQPLLNSQVLAQGGTGATYGVSALNLSLNGNGQQSQLHYKAPTTTTRTVPDGGMTLMLLGMTLGSLAALPRRFRRD